jgi:transglutaminase-like putative cysteine protease
MVLRHGHVATSAGKSRMTFDTFFRASSYAMVACGVLALALAGGVGAGLAAAFAAGLVLSWRAEGSRWQLSERGGMFVVLLALPLFYLDWKYQTAIAGRGARVLAGITALIHFTLLLSTIKLFQVKADRDWLFLYLISFFEVLLAAGLSLSPLFLLGLSVYVFCALLAVVSFELRKARRLAPESESRLLVVNDAKLFRREMAGPKGRRGRVVRRLPVAALCLFVLIFALAFPIFLVTPRASEGSWAMRGGVASTGYVGFSDHVKLGDIGRLQESNQLVMRVRVEGPAAASTYGLRWRGVALDHFDGHSWSQSSSSMRTILPNERGLFPLGTTEDLSRLTTQTFFVEPVDTAALFAAPRAVAVQGALDYVRRDTEGGLLSRPHPQERISYRVYSDTFEPTPERLRADRRGNLQGLTANLRQPIENYLAFPDELDTRIASLAVLVVAEAGARNRYDMAKAIEAHLSRNEYGGAYRYSLEMRASGSDPLADFLFNVRAGHCEYFATAMAVMLRTLNIPTRVVNGFQSGEYNEMADAYIVRQADAHSWVEVYFPETDSWVTFDPTPVAGRPSGATGTGLTAQLQRYAEAMELFWIQYVVAYDKQDQSSLAQSLGSRLGSLADSAEGATAGLSQWWREGGRGQGLTGLAAYMPGPLAPFALLLGLAGVWALRRKGVWPMFARRRPDAEASVAVVEFYERMTRALAERGVRRREYETPLEFAAASGSAEVLLLTEAYNRVRFGGRGLTREERAEVEKYLERIESGSEVNDA